MKQTLHVLQSGSSGNGYIVDTGDEQLIIECGVPVKEALPKLDWDIKNVVGCIVSHSHSDHCKYIKQYQKYFRVYSNPDVASKYPNVEIIEPMMRYTIGGFKVLALPVEHNVECYGYVIDHPDMGRLVFYTDTKSFNYKIPNVNFILGETNYSDNVILDNLCEGCDVRSQYDNHMSLDSAIAVVRRLYSPNLSKVICCHPSDRNADDNEIRRRFKSELGLLVDCANSGDIFELKNCEF